MPFRLRLATLLLAALLGAVCSEQAVAACLSAREARQAVSNGEALRLSAVVRGLGGEVVNAQLCEAGNRLVYQLAVMMPNGRVANIVVDARSGAVIGR
jgi:Predicted membrane protein